MAGAFPSSPFPSSRPSGRITSTNSCMMNSISAGAAPALIEFIMHELVLVIRPEGLEEGKGDDGKAPAMGLHQVAEFLQPPLLLSPDRAAIGREHQFEILLTIGGT